MHLFFPSTCTEGDPFGSKHMNFRKKGKNPKSYFSKNNQTPLWYLSSCWCFAADISWTSMRCLFLWTFWQFPPRHSLPMSPTSQHILALSAFWTIDTTSLHGRPPLFPTMCAIVQHRWEQLLCLEISGWDNDRFIIPDLMSLILSEVSWFAATQVAFGNQRFKRGIFSASTIGVTE